MANKMDNFWDLSIEQFGRTIENQKNFYDMLLSADKGVRNFVYKPEELCPKEKKESKIHNIKFSDCSFAFTKIININFFNCEFVNCKFNHCIIESCRFHDCSFEYVNMFKVQVKNTYIDPYAFKSIIPMYKDFSYSVNNANMCVSFFQTLLNNARDTGQIEFEKNADYHFKKWKGLNYLQKKFTKSPFTDKMGWWLFIRKFIPNLAQYLIIGYGYRVSNFVITFLLGFGFFLYINYTKWSSFVVCKRDVPIVSFNADTANVKSTIFYTLDATTKLIDSQMQPTTDNGMIWLSIQGVFGFILLSGLITIILNKFVK